MNKTYNILCQTESFVRRHVLHIIQCDMEVQDDMRIDSLEHMEAYIRNMTRKGGGGTDFRPAFDHVENAIPQSRQRPIFLVGAPGIGKTAIMQQIASEMDIALVSYSMTHHTRQSALGLPYIQETDFGALHATVSEYTMSEIIAAVYRVMRDSGKQESILFLDEINGVSETLAPAMLLFLQYKIFGNQPVPKGWVVVTAGNPPQYNKSVKEFDVATMDRIKH